MDEVSLLLSDRNRGIFLSRSISIVSCPALRSNAAIWFRIPRSLWQPLLQHSVRPIILAQPQLNEIGCNWVSASRFAPSNLAVPNICAQGHLNCGLCRCYEPVMNFVCRGHEKMKPKRNAHDRNEEAHSGQKISRQNIFR